MELPCRWSKYVTSSLVSTSGIIFALIPMIDLATVQFRPTHFTYDDHMIPADTPGITCRLGYTKNNQNHKEDHGDKYVYTSLWQKNNPATAIDKLSINYYFEQYNGSAPSSGYQSHCNRNSDISIRTNLNQGRPGAAQREWVYTWRANTISDQAQRRIHVDRRVDHSALSCCDPRRKHHSNRCAHAALITGKSAKRFT